MSCIGIMTIMRCDKADDDIDNDSNIYEDSKPKFHEVVSSSSNFLAASR